MTDRERYLRERIEILRTRPEPPPPTFEQVEEHARLMCCDIQQAMRMFESERHSEKRRIHNLILLLEGELAALTKPYVAPLPKPTKPRRK